MTRKIVLVNLVAVGVLGTLIVSTGDKVEAESIESNATITAVQGTDPVKPVDPTDPTNPDKPGPVDPGDGNETNQGGPLQINYVSHLNFGDKIALTGRQVITNVKNETPRFFQVSDLRGTGKGWQLNVSLGDFLSTKNPADKIKGATITFKDGEAVTSNMETTNPATTKNITLSAGDVNPKTLMTAAEGNGRGTWLARYTKPVDATDNNKIIFQAPTEYINTDTNYKAKLSWQLLDTPK